MEVEFVKQDEEPESVKKEIIGDTDNQEVSVLDEILSATSGPKSGIEDNAANSNESKKEVLKKFIDMIYLLIGTIRRVNLLFMYRHGLLLEKRKKSQTHSMNLFLTWHWIFLLSWICSKRRFDFHHFSDDHLIFDEIQSRVATIIL